MERHPTTPPSVLVFAGVDSTGGAGIQADIEAIASMGAHATPVITATTVQDTHEVRRCTLADPIALIEQTRAVLEDMPVAGCKIGLVPDAKVIAAIHSILTDYPDLPVVLDPVLASGSGNELLDDEAADALRVLLVPLATVVTPNSREVRSLAPEADNPDASAQALMSMGAEYVLVTGTHEDTAQVTNVLYGNRRRLESFNWERLPHSYHGSGCTLASAIAALLSQGIQPLAAVHKAQQYTWRTLRHGYRAGTGQLMPDRFFWTRDKEGET